MPRAAKYNSRSGSPRAPKWARALAAARLGDRSGACRRRARARVISYDDSKLTFSPGARNFYTVNRTCNSLSDLVVHLKDRDIGLRHRRAPNAMRRPVPRPPATQALHPDGNHGVRPRAMHRPMHMRPHPRPRPSTAGAMTIVPIANAHVLKFLYMLRRPPGTGYGVEGLVVQQSVEAVRQEDEETLPGGAPEERGEGGRGRGGEGGVQGVEGGQRVPGCRRVGGGSYARRAWRDHSCWKGSFAGEGRRGRAHVSWFHFREREGKNCSSRAKGRSLIFLCETDLTTAGCSLSSARSIASLPRAPRLASRSAIRAHSAARIVGSYGVPGAVSSVFLKTRYCSRTAVRNRARASRSGWPGAGRNHSCAKAGSEAASWAANCAAITNDSRNRVSRCSCQGTGSAAGREGGPGARGGERRARVASWRWAMSTWAVSCQEQICAFIFHFIFIIEAGAGISEKEGTATARLGETIRERVPTITKTARTAMLSMLKSASSISARKGAREGSRAACTICPDSTKSDVHDRVN